MEDIKATFKRLNLINLASSGSMGLVLYSQGKKNPYSKNLLNQGIEFCEEMGDIIYLANYLENPSTKLDISGSEKGKKNFQNLYIINDFSKSFSREEFTPKIISVILPKIKDGLLRCLNNAPLEDSECKRLQLILRYMNNNLWGGIYN